MRFTLLFVFVIGFFTLNGQTTQLAASFCPSTITNIGANITCSNNLGQGHRFEVRKMDNTLVGVYDAIAANVIFPTRSKYIFRFSWMSGCGIDYGTTYKIAVSWYNGSVWSAYGSQCQVTTPSNVLQINSSFCNTIIASMGTTITANVSRMCGHRFEVRETDETLIGVYDGVAGAQSNPGRSPHEFRFTWMTGLIQYSTTYRIRVSYYDNTTSSWSTYGPYCDITTPDLPLTQLTTAWCDNSNVASSTTSIFCTSIAGTYQYQFSISAPGYGSIIDLVKGTNSFKLSELPAPHPLPGLQYDVLVSTRQVIADPFGPAGNQCFVKLKVPTTVISSIDCGTTKNYLQQDTIHALPISGAQGYRYRIVNGATSIIDTVANVSAYNGVTFRKFPGIEYCKTYSMSVKVLMNGTWSDWGAACNISTTCAPTTDLRPGFISNSTIESCATNIYFNSILFATIYEYSVDGGSVNDIFQLNGSGFKLSQIPSVNSLTYNTTYNVKCRVFVNGSWQSWGTIRPITLSKQIQLGALCNSVVPTMGTNVYSGSVGCATDYRFRLNGPGLSNYVHNPSTMTNRFQPSQLLGQGIQYNQTYTVDVAYLVGGVWSAYGPSCTITTPSAIMPNQNQSFEAIKEENDEFSESTLANSLEINQELESVQVFPNPSLNSFTLMLSNSEETGMKHVISVIDFSGKIMEEIYIESNSEITFGERLPHGVYFLHELNNSLSKPIRIVKL